MNISNIENILLKHKQNPYKIPAINAVGAFSQQLISPVVLFPSIFSIYYEYLFSRTPVSVCYLLSFLLEISQTYYHKWLFWFFFSSKNNCTSFIQTGTWNFSSYSDVSVRFSTAFQNIETAFERCFIKGVVQ